MSQVEHLQNKLQAYKSDESSLEATYEKLDNQRFLALVLIIATINWYIIVAFGVSTFFVVDTELESWVWGSATIWFLMSATIDYVDNHIKKGTQKPRRMMGPVAVVGFCFLW